MSPCSIEYFLILLEVREIGSGMLADIISELVSKSCHSIYSSRYNQKLSIVNLRSNSSDLVERQM